MKPMNLGNTDFSIELNYQKFKKCLDCIKAIDHPIRQRILSSIEDLEENATLQQISKDLKLNSTNINQHLSTLQRVNLINHYRASDSEFVYVVNESLLERTAQLMEELDMA